MTGFQAPKVPCLQTLFAKAVHNLIDNHTFPDYSISFFKKNRYHSAHILVPRTCRTQVMDIILNQESQERDCLLWDISYQDGLGDILIVIICDGNRF